MLALLLLLLLSLPRTALKPLPPPSRSLVAGDALYRRRTGAPPSPCLLCTPSPPLLPPSPPPRPLPDSTLCSHPGPTSPAPSCASDCAAPGPDAAAAATPPEGGAWILGLRFRRRGFCPPSSGLALSLSTAVPFGEARLADLCWKSTSAASGRSLVGLARTRGVPANRRLALRTGVDSVGASTRRPSPWLPGRTAGTRASSSAALRSNALAAAARRADAPRPARLLRACTPFARSRAREPLSRAPLVFALADDAAGMVRACLHDHSKAGQGCGPVRPPLGKLPKQVPAASRTPVSIV